SRSLFPKPPPPICGLHLSPSIGEPSGASNSSLQTRFHPGSSPPLLADALVLALALASATLELAAIELDAEDAWLTLDAPPCPALDCCVPLPAVAHPPPDPEPSSPIVPASHPALVAAAVATSIHETKR